MVQGNKPHMPDNKGLRQASGDDLDQRRLVLEEKLTRKGVLNQPTPDEKEDKAPQGTAQALKLSSEFVAGVVVGILLGLGFDLLLGTTPWGLVIFLFLGFAAGVMNVLRTVGRIAPSAIELQSLKRNEDIKNGRDKASRPKK